MHFTFDIEQHDEGQCFVTVNRDGEPWTIHGPMPAAATGPFVAEMSVMLPQTLDRLLSELLVGVQQAKNEAGT